MSKSPPPLAANPRALSLVWLAIALTVPAMVLRFTGFHPVDSPITGLLVFGTCVVAAAFLLTWAAETAEQDMGSGLAVVFLALVTVLPEYTVDVYLSWRGGTDPEYQGLALANMTGANRLLIGMGWPIVALLVWYREGRAGIHLRRERSGDVVYLLAATLYSALIPLKGSLAWYDAVVLALIYAAYVRSSKGDAGEEHDIASLVGPPRVMAAWDRTRRLRTTTALFVGAAAAILASSEPFSESLVRTGEKIGVDKYLLIQWLAPLASEAPEFVVVVLLTMRGRSEMGLAAFISSKVNQWTLLVGGVPVAFGLSRLYHGHGWAAAMAIDGRQVEELWLTVTQGLYAIATIADLYFSLRQALVILALFLVQFGGSLLIESGLGRGMGIGHAQLAVFHNGLSVLYAVLALWTIGRQSRHLVQRLGDVRHGVPAPAGGPIEQGGAGGPDESDA